MTAVMVNINSPNKIRIYKGNKPFVMKWFDEMDSMIYAPNGDYFESVMDLPHTITGLNRIDISNLTQRMKSK